MGARKRRLVKILQELIALSYPKLIDVRIDLVKSKDKDEFLACSGNRVKGYVVYYAKAIDKLDDFALKGIAAHELCHIENMQALHPVIVYLENVLSLFPFVDSYSERKTDAQVIKKGYGKNLLAFQKYHDRKFEPYTKADGLTKKEIKKLIE